MRLLPLLAAGALSAALAAPFALAQASLPALFASAIAETIAAEAPYSFETRIESERGVMRYAYDASASGRARVRLLEPAESALDRRGRATLERIRREADGDIWCAGRKLRTARNVTVAREDAATITYAFQPSPEQAGGERGASIVRHLRGEAVVARESRDVTAIRIRAAAPFHASVARVDAFTMNVRCDLAPNGRRYGAETVTHIAGSAFGQAFNERSVQRVSNLRR
jgi:hypothetical protein